MQLQKTQTSIQLYEDQNIEDVDPKENVFPYFDQVPIELVAHIVHDLCLKDLFSFTKTENRFAQTSIYFLENNLNAQNELVKFYQSFRKCSIPLRYLQVCTTISSVHFYDKSRTEEEICSFVAQLSKLKDFSLSCEKALNVGVLESLGGSEDSLEQLTLQFEELSISPKTKVFLSFQNVHTLNVLANFSSKDFLLTRLMCAMPNLEMVRIAGRKENRSEVDLAQIANSFGSITTICCSVSYVLLDLHKEFREGYKRITRLEFSLCQSLDDEMIKNIAKVCTCLKELTLEECINIEGTTLDHLAARCVQLESFTCKSMWSLTENSLSEFSKKVKSLRKLCFFRIASLVDQHVLFIALRNKALESVNISHCSNLTERAVSTFATYCAELQFISLSGILSVHDQVIRNLFATSKKIVGIEIDSIPNLSKVSYYSIASMGMGLRKLSMSPEKRVKPKVLSSLFQRCRAIERLQLREIHSEGRDFFIEWSKDLSCLKHLKLVRNSWVTDGGLKLLSEHCTSLRKLSFNFCSGITIDGIRHIMKNCHMVKKIEIEGCSKISVEEKEYIQTYYGMPKEKASFTVSRLSF